MNWRRVAFAMFVGGAMWASSVATAQQKPAASPPVAPAPGAPNPSVQTVNVQGYWLEWGLVIVMTGVALYSVCRGSRRNV